MTLLRDPQSISASLTNAHKNEEQISRTHSGMAYFAGTGPEGKTCKECSFWQFRVDGYHGKSGPFANLLKAHPCAKFSQLSQGKIGDKVPPNASACKYFEPSKTVRRTTRPT